MASDGTSYEMPTMDEKGKEELYVLLLLGPFILIPFGIVMVRFIKYFYRYYQAKKTGDVSQLGITPIMELGLMLSNDNRTIKRIKKIQKEQEAIKKWKETQKIQQTLVKDEPSKDNKKMNKGLEIIDVIRATTKKTWSERLSPEAVRQFFGTTKYGRMWMIFQVTCTAIAIFNYVLLTYSIGNSDRFTVKRVDVALATIFAIDYAISFYTAEDRLRFYFHFDSLIDLLSIIPPFIYVLVPDTSPFVWFLSVLRILRASRVLRTYRILSFSESEEKRELIILILTFLNFLFLSASLINALETLKGNQPQKPSLQNWHDSLYYIMVTFSTIGFGDLTPTTIPSRILVMILIIMVIVFVPLQSGKLSELYNSTNAYQRARYVSSADRAHVIVSGVVTHGAILDFCREYFANDPMGHVVVLATDTPSDDIRKLLRHPYYRHRVYYLCGSPLNISDLKRCCADEATGIFLLNTESHKASLSNDEEQLRVTRGADADILMQSLVIRTTFPGSAIYSQVQDIRSQDLAKQCGSDRTVCIDEIKMSLLARNCLVPGILTLIMNLVHTYHENDIQEKSWKYEYNEGAANQLFSLKPPNGFIGRSFAQVAAVVYQSFGFTIIGIKSRSNDIRLCPGKDFLIHQDDVLFCIGNGGDDVMLRLYIHFADSQAFNMELSMEQTVNENEMAVPLKSASQESPTQHLGTNIVSPFEQTFHDFKNHIILCGKMTARGIRHFVHTIRSGEDTITPIVCILEDIPNTSEGIWVDIVGHPEVHLVKGTPLKKTNLISSGIAECKRIVIFTSGESLKSADSSPSIPDANSIFIIQMIKENWPKSNFIVEMVNGSNIKYFSARDHQFDLTNMRMESVLNNYSLTISDRLNFYKQLKVSTAPVADNILKRTIRFIQAGNSAKSPRNKETEVLLKPMGNTKEEATDEVRASIVKNDAQDQAPMAARLSQLEQEAEIKESGLSPFPVYHFDRYFASGMVATLSFINSLLCQAYFRPYLIDMVKLLLKQVILVQVPASFHQKTYGELMRYLIQMNKIPIGLYRNATLLASPTHPMTKTASSSRLDFDVHRLPHVYTNCKVTDLVTSSDMIFLIENTEKKQ